MDIFYYHSVFADPRIPFSSTIDTTVIQEKGETQCGINLYATAGFMKYRQKFNTLVIPDYIYMPENGEVYHGNGFYFGITNKSLILKFFDLEYGMIFEYHFCRSSFVFTPDSSRYKYSESQYLISIPIHISKTLNTGLINLEPGLGLVNSFLLYDWFNAERILANNTYKTNYQKATSVYQFSFAIGICVNSPKLSDRFFIAANYCIGLNNIRYSDPVYTEDIIGYVKPTHYQTFRINTFNISIQYLLTKRN
jgi:hypothetical protein